MNLQYANLTRQDREAGPLAMRLLDGRQMEVPCRPFGEFRAIHLGFCQPVKANVGKHHDMIMLTYHPSALVGMR